MKFLLAIAKPTVFLLIMAVLLNLNNKERAYAHHHLLAFNWLMANAQDTATDGNIIAIRDLQPGKVQTISGVVAAFCDDEFILRDDSSPIVVKVDLEAEKIKLFQGERLSVIGIFHNDELEAFQIKKSNGELIKLNTAHEDLF